MFTASAATFSRFIPTIKARFDYGAMIFILTFSLVSVSGYRIDELFNMAQQRISTIIIGTSLCIIVSTTVRPVWAGLELYVLVTGNLDKLANSLQGQSKYQSSFSYSSMHAQLYKLLKIIFMCVCALFRLCGSLF